MCSSERVLLFSNLNSHELLSELHAGTEMILKNADGEKAWCFFCWCISFRNSASDYYCLWRDLTIIIIIILAMDELIASAWPFDLSRKGRAEFTQYAWYQNRGGERSGFRNGNSYSGDWWYFGCLPAGPRRGNYAMIFSFLRPWKTCWPHKIHLFQQLTYSALCTYGGFRMNLAVNGDYFFKQR